MCGELKDMRAVSARGGIGCRLLGALVAAVVAAASVQEEGGGVVPLGESGEYGVGLPEHNGEEQTAEEVRAHNAALEAETAAEMASEQTKFEAPAAKNPWGKHVVDWKDAVNIANEAGVELPKEMKQEVQHAAKGDNDEVEAKGAMKNVSPEAAPVYVHPLKFNIVMPPERNQDEASFSEVANGEDL